MLWLNFLFSILGISTSDFFCPNLATIAPLLNLDEYVAGVTFLALGNGSPDVFATFAALRTNAEGLVIGKLMATWRELRREKMRLLLEARIRSEFQEEVQSYWDHEPYGDYEPYRDERERCYCIRDPISHGT